MARSKAVPNQQRIRQPPKRMPVLTPARTFGQKSPIVDGDIQTFLMSCMGSDQWEAYTEEEKKGIIRSLPASRQPRKNPFHDQPTEYDKRTLATPPLSPVFVASDTYLKRAIARFKRDVSDAYYEKTWQDIAKKAHKDRIEGQFDPYLKQHVEEMFVEDKDESEDGDVDELGTDGEYTEGRKGHAKKLKTNGSVYVSRRGSADVPTVNNGTRANIAVRRAPQAVT